MLSPAGARCACKKKRWTHERAINRKTSNRNAGATEKNCGGIHWRADRGHNRTRRPQTAINPTGGASFERKPHNCLAVAASWQASDCRTPSRFKARPVGSDHPTCQKRGVRMKKLTTDYGRGGIVGTGEGEPCDHCLRAATETVLILLSSGHVGRCCAACHACRKGRPFASKAEYLKLQADGQMTRGQSQCQTKTVS